MLVPKAVSISLIAASTAGALRAEAVGGGGPLVDRDQDRRHAEVAQLELGSEGIAKAAEVGAGAAIGRRWLSLSKPASSPASTLPSPAETPPLGGGSDGVVVAGGTRVSPCLTGAGAGRGVAQSWRFQSGALAPTEPFFGC